jgi:CheY-like chemotaxis protein
MVEQAAVEILYVEDNPNDAELALRALKKHGIAHQLHLARDGVEALEFLREACGPAGASCRLRLIMIDVKLPRISGLEVLRTIREDARMRLIPVVMLTSSGEPRDIAEAYARGANSYVVKPVDFDQFLETVGMIGRYWLQLNEQPRSWGE